MSFIDRIIVSFFCTKAGEDQFGNKYYTGGAFKDYLGKEKRYVVYNGVPEPSKVPPLWHAWLHHLSDEIPSQECNYAWQQGYSPNLTGTKYSYCPKISDSQKNKIYNNWQP